MIRKKIIIVAGARPNFIKIAPLIDEIKKRGNIEYIIVHTGQHYDKNLSTSFFEDLNIPKPDINLKINSTSQIKQVAEIMSKFEDVLLDAKPDLVIVVGDVNSTLACALTTSRLNIRLTHIEAGLRSHDRTMPEEINRILVDALSDYHFTTEPDAKINLLKEGLPENNIFFVGNIMIDTLVKNIKIAELKSKILKQLNISSNNYVLLTLHRQSNVDSKTKLKDILKTIKEIQQKTIIVFSLHPRTRNNLNKFNLFGQLKKMNNVILTEPLGYFDFLNLIKNAKFILTDSGGVQEESTYLNIPCLTMRENTERPTTITHGTNILVGNNHKKIIKEITKIYSTKVQQSYKTPKLWDGNTAKRIVDLIYK